MFSNSSRIRRKRKFYYIIFFGVCVGGFKNFFGFLEIWCEMLEMEGRGGADAAHIFDIKDMKRKIILRLP